MILTFWNMHGFLFVSKTEDSLNSEIQKKAGELKSEILEFPVKGIEDIREIIKFSQLSLNKKSIILLRNIDKLSSDALNAFLKSLEEPQANLTYFLTTSSIYKVVPTIISRCQIIKIKDNEAFDNDNSVDCLNFIKAGEGERLKRIYEIRDRESAIEFLQKFITGCHYLVHQKKESKKYLLKALVQSQKTLNNIGQNGNISLQLTNFAINI